MNEIITPRYIHPADRHWKLFFDVKNVLLCFASFSAFQAHDISYFTSRATIALIVCYASINSKETSTPEVKAFTYFRSTFVSDEVFYSLSLSLSRSGCSFDIQRSMLWLSLLFGRKNRSTEEKQLKWYINDCLEIRLLISVILQIFSAFNFFDRYRCWCFNLCSLIVPQTVSFVVVVCFFFLRSSKMPF